MARNFDGANDNIHCSSGTLSTFTFGTMAAIIKRNGTAFQNIMTLHNSAGTSRAGIEIEDNGTGNHIQWQFDGSFVSSTAITVVNANNWVLIAMGKPTGTAAVRCHKYVYDTNTWTHENSNGTGGNNTAPGASSTMRFGEWEGGDDFNGDIAAAGVWIGRSLADLEVEQLAFSLQGWISTAPDALWLFDQQATTQNVVDLTGNGANQSSLGGTTVSTNSVPVFGYGHEVVRVQRVVGAAGTNANAGVAATTFATNGATTAVAPSVGNAAATFSANNATVTTAVVASAEAAAVTVTANGTTAVVQPSAGAASATFVANGVTAAAAPSSGAASVVFTAGDATVLTGTAASAGSAAATFAANGVTAQVATSAGASTATFVGQNATVATATSAGAAAATFTANGATTSVAPHPGHGTIAFTANNATVTAAGGGTALAQAATWTLVAPAPGGSATPRGTTHAPVAFAALAATVSTASTTNAAAGAASWTTTALAAATRGATTADAASATFAANSATANTGLTTGARWGLAL